jgi:hypothetical protein
MTPGEPQVRQLFELTGLLERLPLIDDVSVLRRGSPTPRADALICRLVEGVRW